jgi:hypothetical protein
MALQHFPRNWATIIYRSSDVVSNDESFLVQPKRSCLDEIYSVFVFVTFTFGRIEFEIHK